MPKREYDFDEQLALGRLGEDKVFAYLNNLEETALVIDATKHKQFQSFGIDGFIVTDPGDNEQFSGMFFDIKTDWQFYRSGKLFIEVYADIAKKGGILSTKAEVFYYYDPYSGKMFRLPIYALKRWYERVGISMHHKSVKNKHGQKTSGVVVSPLDLESEGVPIKAVDIGILET